MGETQKVGALGEELVATFLMKRGHKILVRNYRRPWGELDVVSEKDQKIHFVEVKTLSQEVSDETSKDDVSRYTPSKVKKDRFRAEDHVNKEKTKRLSRIIQTYIIEKHVSSETLWQFDVATVLLDTEKRKAKINLIEDIII